MENHPQWHAGRWVLGLVALQGLAGVLLVSGDKAPGVFVGAAVALLGWLVWKQGWISARTMLGLAGLGAMLGLLYPWPWIRTAEADIERIATVRKLVGPDGCVCVGLTTPPLWEGDPSSAQAVAFCVPDSETRFVPWLETGTVATQWRISLRSTAMDPPVLHANQLLRVDGVAASMLYANNGCRP